MAHDEHGNWIGYGLGDTSPEVTKVNYRLLHAYPRNSRAVEHGVVEGDFYSLATEAAVRDLARFINNSPHDLETMAGGRRLDRAADLGVADLAFRRAIGAYIPPPASPPRQKYPAQGVWADSRAFLNPPDAHSYVKATDAFAAEGYRLYEQVAGTPIWVLGYSMGGTSVKKFLNRLRPEWREHVAGVITFGDPAMPADGSLLGNDPGRGISGVEQPLWVRDRYWSYSIDGDWYPRARGLLFMLYEVLSRAELTLEFAVWLFTAFPQRAMQELLGLRDTPGDDPLDRMLNGVLAPLAPLLGGGRGGGPLDPFAILGVLPDLVYLLFDAIKFVATGAHGAYGDPNYRLWEGMTAVDHAAEVIREHSPDGATLYLFPGTWSTWDQLFPFDTWLRLSGEYL